MPTSKPGVDGTTMVALGEILGVAAVVVFAFGLWRTTDSGAGADTASGRRRDGLSP